MGGVLVMFRLVGCADVCNLMLTSLLDCAGRCLTIRAHVRLNVCNISMLLVGMQVFNNSILSLALQDALREVSGHECGDNEFMMLSGLTRCKYNMRSTGIKISRSVCKICALLEIVVWMRFELTRDMYKYEGIMPKTPKRCQNDKCYRLPSRSANSAPGLSFWYFAAIS
jgi:hypothetical protein